MSREIDIQAADIEQMLPRMMRRMFSLGINEGVSDLPVAQLRMCTYLLGEGSSSVSEIAEELGTSVSATTQIADRLEKTGLVHREAGLQDRRVRLLSLTEHGRALMGARRDRRVARVVEVLGTMPPELRCEVRAAIKALLAASTDTPHAAVPKTDEE